MRFIFTHSHAFPGGMVVIENLATSGAAAGVEFADGAALEAECQRDGTDLILEIPAYRTAKGTAVGAHRWRVVRDETGTWHSRREP